MNIKVNLQPKVAGVGVFTPPEGYENINGEWVKVESASDNNSSDISEASEDQ